MDESALRRQTLAEIAHWRLAIDSLGELDTVASPGAWSSLESYLRSSVRDRMLAMVADLQSQAAALWRMLQAGQDVTVTRSELLRLRRRYLQAETILDFYGDAINTRSNPAIGALLRGYDTLAGDSMAATFAPLGMDTPPALVYIDKGLGAAILRAGVRLWDKAHPSPAAAIKLTRHNLSHPLSLLHETGHMVNHQVGLNAELASALEDTLSPRSPVLAQLFGSFASELAADVHAFVQSGWAAVAALANVVDGSTRAVYRIRPGDPHPWPAVRVAFNVGLCKSWFGSGPWDDIGDAWLQRHPVEQGGAAGELTSIVFEAMDEIVDVCTRRPMRAFRGRPITGHLDPARVAPAALEKLSKQAGSSLLTSSYLRRQESLRILGLLASRSVTDPERAAEHRSNLRTWVTAIGADSTLRTSPSTRRAA